MLLNVSEKSGFAPQTLFILPLGNALYIVGTQYVMLMMLLKYHNTQE